MLSHFGNVLHVRVLLLLPPPESRLFLFYTVIVPKIGLVSVHWSGFSSSVDHYQCNYFQDIVWRPKSKVNVSDSIKRNEAPRGRVLEFYIET